MSATMERVFGPLPGTATPGTWIWDRLAVEAMPNGFIEFGVLLPQDYDPTKQYACLFVTHENDEGMLNGTYPNDGPSLVNQDVFNGSYNTPAFRKQNPCICVLPMCDQTINQSGANANANYAGYDDEANSGGNEQGVNALVGHIKATYSADPTRFLAMGNSLGAIGVLAWLDDNNAYDGIFKIWAGGVGLSDQLYRPGIDNSTIFPRMLNVPYFAISTPNDNNQAIYDQAAYTYFTGGSTSFPTEAEFAQGGMAAVRAGSSQFFFIETTQGVPWPKYNQMAADGGVADPIYNWLFQLVAPGADPAPTPVPVPTPVPTPAPTPSPTPSPVLASIITEATAVETAIKGMVSSLQTVVTQLGSIT